MATELSLPGATGESRDKEATQLPNVDIEIAHRTATLCILGNLAYQLRRKLTSDAIQRVVGDEQANRLLGSPQRYPYQM